MQYSVSYPLHETTYSSFDQQLRVNSVSKERALLDVTCLVCTLLSMACSTCHIKTRKMVPITGRARSFLLVFKNKIERRGRQNKSNRPINLLNGIIFSTYFKYTTQS